MSNDNIKSPVLSASFENSSLIKDIEYDTFMSVLTVKFKNDTKYDFLNVDEKMFFDFKNTESPGKFFHTNIRNKYEFFKKSLFDADKKQPQTDQTVSEE